MSAMKCGCVLIVIATFADSLMSAEPSEPLKVLELRSQDARKAVVEGGVISIAVERGSGDCVAFWRGGFSIIDDESGAVTRSVRNSQIGLVTKAAFRTSDSAIVRNSLGDAYHLDLRDGQSRSVARRCLGFSKDGKQIVGGSCENLRIFDADTFKVRWEGQALGNYVQFAEVSSRGGMILTGPQELDDEDEPTRLQLFSWAKKSKLIMSSDEFTQVKGHDDCVVRLSHAAYDPLRGLACGAGRVEGSTLLHIEAAVVAVDATTEEKLWGRFYPDYQVTSLSISETGKFVVVCLFRNPQRDRQGMITRYYPDVLEILDGRTGKTTIRCEAEVGLFADAEMVQNDKLIFAASERQIVYSWKVDPTSPRAFPSK